MKKFVARYADGRVFKGTTLDFSPGKDLFHLALATSPVGAASMPIRTKELKALFVVKDLTGDPRYVESKEHDSDPPPGGRWVRAAFKDGEVLVGATIGYRLGHAGFFLEPADAKSNNERCYVVAEATREVVFL
jgi:hypothetical protein